EGHSVAHTHLAVVTCRRPERLVHPDADQRRLVVGERAVAVLKPHRVQPGGGVGLVHRQRGQGGGGGGPVSVVQVVGQLVAIGVGSAEVDRRGQWGEPRDGAC